MPRHFAEKEILVASHNAGKVREISALLMPLGITVTSSADHSLSEPIEDGKTFVENAEIKARQSCKESGLPSLADDSGLVVPALDGAPGIYSARWAGPDKDFGLAMQRIKDELGDKDPAAYFVCVLSLAWPDGHVESFEGRVDGTLVFPPRGQKGFGYDPIFVSHGDDKTFAEIDPEEKHRISHRADAFTQLMAGCFRGE